MIILKPEAARKDILGSIKRQMLIPIIGSGFTRNCTSRHGVVPSGAEYRDYMIKAIAKSRDLTETDLDSITRGSFSEISTIYHEIVPKDERLNYLSDHFTRVTLEKCKRQFLSLNWSYIYTLNIDDAIENNSEYNHIVYSNRSVHNNIFDQHKCVIKLHGDITEMLTYDDAVSEVFDQRQYVLSLQQNKSLLTRLTHDLSYQNPIFIGCSLSDEIDLLSVSGNATIGSIRYYCMVGEPSVIEKIKLEKNYGITHCIVFNQFCEIYKYIYDIAIEANNIEATEIDNYKSICFARLKADFEINKAYLFFGKSLINKDRTISLPYYFISRERTSLIIKNIDHYAVQLVLGNSCSGKSYTCIDIAMHIRDRDVFIFESKDSLNNNALEYIINRGNCLIIADSGSLNMQQIERIIRNINSIKEKKVHCIIVSNKNNSDLSGLIRLLEINGNIEYNSIRQTVIPQFLSKVETERINTKLVETTLAVFTESKSVVDNIIEASKVLMQRNKYSSITPCFDNSRMVACLIALSIEQKIYSYQMVEYDIVSEMERQLRLTYPLIEKESTWNFETSPSNNSSFKIVINAEYWLNNQLDAFSKNQQNLEVIVLAFRYIISQIILNYGKPDIMYSDKYDCYKQYILFNNINRVFKTQGLLVARAVYDNINDLLAGDPHYMHQRAKCLIKYAKIIKSPKEKKEILEKAYRYASIAFGIFRNRYDECGNEKIRISMDHVQYSMALILCHLCKNNAYSDIEMNTNAINTLYFALLSPHNSYDYVKNDSFNYGNVVKELVISLMVDSFRIDQRLKKYLIALYKKIVE